MSENRLAAETSPYLLQHKDNPVHWRAWGPAALAEARAQNKPILLSVGYAACHWCHVMAHESFEDAETADVMNDLFVNIKVDREERPDVDAIYMAALHALGEHGGWPLTMFLAPDGRPFWGGTYFPKTARYGKPDFKTVLKEIAKVFREDPAKILQNADAITAGLRETGGDGAKLPLDDNTLANIAMRLVSITDPAHGGIKGAPKFPQWSFLWLLWRAGMRYSLAPAREAVLTALTHMCQGGIYDHLGGGFARYSVDERWLAPHFEKMLYDNALLVDLMSEVWRETQDPLLEMRVRETIDWVLREMVANGSGFAASLDADSEGEEGKFYVWDAGEIARVLGSDDAQFFGRIYDVSAEGNWEGHTILNRLDHLALLSPDEERRLANLREKLLAVRGKRIRPGWDDKVLADWNGLMIGALSHAGRTFRRPEWILAAERAFQFVVQHMMTGDRLSHSARSGRADAPATASDYANMIHGALRLHQVTGNAAYLTQAGSWAGVLDRHYLLIESGKYAFTANDTPDLIARLSHGHDDATPNANSVMVTNLMAMFVLTGKDEYTTRAQGVLDAFGGQVTRNLFGYTGLIGAGFDAVAPQLIVIVGDVGDNETIALAGALNRVSTPGAIVQIISATDIVAANSPLAGKGTLDGKPTAYVCVGPQCSAPVTAPDKLVSLIRGLRLKAMMSSNENS